LIVLLRERPEALPLVAAWRFGEWGENYPGETLEQWQRGLEKEAAGDGIPTVLVALDDNKAVGTASLVQHDIEGDPRSPWLASVFVAPEVRGRGIASALVSEIERRATRLGTTRLYLFTANKMSLYARLGWRGIERRMYQGKAIEIMAKDLAR
jgi:GNAT superfamily N-acetyltransferase